MKARIATLSTFFCLILCTCGKNGVGPGDAALKGKWILSEALADPGNGSGKWVPVPQNADSEYVTFDGNSKLSGTVFPTYVIYSIKDSVTLLFKTADNVLQNYRYKINGNVMYMSPAGPIMCFESCGIKLVKASK